MPPTLRLLFRFPRRRCLLCGSALAAVLFLAIAYSRTVIAAHDESVFAIEDAPARRVALVLGCAPKLKDGRENLFFRHRIDCAARLFHSGKVEWLLVSGDNSRRDYDEPTAMKAALVAKGVAAERIVIDYAGFSTLDSVARARRVFGQDSIAIVSQRDHATRALYIAEREGIKAIGIAAEGVNFRDGLKTRLRESLARVKAVVDTRVLNRQPRFLGPKVEIGASSK